MKIESLEEILKEHPFLSDLDARHVVHLLSCASNRRFAAGELISREGEKADVLYLLREGQVALETHVPQKGGLRIETLHGGDILGWSGFVPPYRWIFDARAVAPVRAAALDSRCLRTKCDEDPAFGYEIYKRIAPRIVARLNAARLQLADLFGDLTGTPPRARR